MMSRRIVGQVVVAIALAAALLLSAARPVSSQSAQIASAPRANPAQGIKSGDFPAYKPPHGANGKPDLSGIWQAFVTADIDVLDHSAQAGPHADILGAYSAWPGGQGIVDGGAIPYKPETLAQKKANAEKRMVVNITPDEDRHATGDPELKCYRPGIPRANYMPFPFQIVQSTDQIAVVYEFAHALRLIYMKEDPKESPKNSPSDYWMGWSHGH
jgi:hypothetical protein